MRTVTKDTITDVFLSYCADTTDARLRTVLESLVTHLHSFARDVNLTHEEWTRAIQFLVDIGNKSTPERNEFILLSDVLGLSSLVDMINSAPEATPSSVLGPFHIRGAPKVAVGGDLRGENETETVIVSGRIVDPDGKPIPGGEMEIWQTAANGLYSNQDPDQTDYNLRAHMSVGEDGYYAFTTIRPAPYTVPDDGPVGQLLHATGRHPWRPSHLHFIVEAPGYRTLVTELFPDDDPYLDEDAVFGVRDALVLKYQRHEDKSELPDGLADGTDVTLPFYTVNFNFILAPESQA